jgi:hypothetical protein
MRSRECRRTVLRASDDSGQRRDFTTSGHVSIQLKSRPEIKVYPYNVGEENPLFANSRQETILRNGRKNYMAFALLEAAVP